MCCTFNDQSRYNYSHIRPYVSVSVRAKTEKLPVTNLTS